MAGSEEVVVVLLREARVAETVVLAEVVVEIPTPLRVLAVSVL